MPLNDPRFSDDQDDDDVFVAELVQSNPTSDFLKNQPNDQFGPPENSNGGCIIGFLLVGSFVLISTVIGAFLIAKQNSDAAKVPSKKRAYPYGFVSTSIDPVYLESLSQLQEEGRNAFNNPEAISDDPEFEEISAFAKDLAKTLDSTANNNLKALIDASRYAREVKFHELDGYNLPSRREIRGSRTLGPIPFRTVEIFKIVRINQSERKVILNANSFRQSVPSIWWLAKQPDGRWKIYDWIGLGYGLTYSKERALTFGEYDDQREKVWNLHAEVATKLIVENKYIGDKYDKDEIAEMLREVELAAEDPKSVHPLLRKTILLETAAQWVGLGEPDQALTVLDMIDSPELTPDVFLTRSEIYLRKREYEKAKTELEKYQSILGSNHLLLTNLAECYENLGDVNSEKETRRLALSYPVAGYSNNIVQLMEVEKTEDFPQLVRLIGESPFADAKYLNLISAIGNNDYYVREMEFVEEYLRENRPNSSLYYKSLAQLNFMNSDFESGFKNLKESLEEDFDEYEFWSTVADKGMTRETFSKLKPDEQKDAFECVSELYDSGDYDISDTEYLQIINTYQKNHKEDPSIPYLLGRVKYYNSDYDLATKHFEEVMKQPEDSLDEYQLKSCRSQLMICYYKLERLDDVIELANDTPSSSLFRLAKRDGKLESLSPIFEKMDRRSNARVYFEALKGSEENPNKAIEELSKLIDKHNRLNGEEARTNPIDEKQIFSAWDVRSEIFELCRGQGKPLLAFEKCESNEMFDLVKRHFLDLEDWEQSESLIKLAKAKLGKDGSFFDDNSRLQRFVDEVSFRSGNYAHFLTKTSEDTESKSTADYEMAFRAAIRLKDFDAARTFAAKESYKSNRLKAILALNEKSLGEFSNYQSKLSDWEKDFYLNDEDVPKLTDEELVKIGRNAPFRFPGWKSGYRLELLTKTHRSFSESEMRQLAETLFEKAEFDLKRIENLPKTHEGWILRSGEHRLILTFTLDPNKKFKPEKDFDTQLNQAFSQHGSAVSIVVDRDTSYLSSPRRTLGISLAQKIATESELLAFGVQSYWGTADQFESISDKLIARELTSGDLNKTLTLRFSQYQEPTPQERELTREYEKGLMQALRKFHDQQPSAELIITMKTQIANVPETHRVKLKSVRPSGSLIQCVGELDSSPIVIDRFQPGNLVQFWAYLADSWELTVDGEVTSGTRPEK